MLMVFNQNMESTVQEEDITQAIETERKLKDNRDVVNMYDVGHSEGFYPCRVTEFKTIESERFNNLQPDNFDEDHRVLRSGFYFMENETLDKIENLGLSLPRVEGEDIITIKFELVGANEKWEMREFWSLNEFPENQYLLTIPSSELGNIIHKIVPIIKQPTFGPNGKDKKYIIASLAEKNLNKFPTHEAGRESVPQMTVHGDTFSFRMLTPCILNFGLVGVAMGLFGPSHTGTALSLLVSMMISFLLLRRSDWFYIRLYNIVGDAQLPSNPYHNQFESVSEFHKETKMCTTPL